MADSEEHNFSDQCEDDIISDYNEDDVMPDEDVEDDGELGQSREVEEYNIDDDEPFTDEEDNNKKKGVRGVTKMLDIIKNRSKGEKFTLSRNKQGQLIYKNGIKYQGYLGVLARRKVPICYTDWLKVPDRYKDSIWFKIQV